jgi:hypothetical protein
VIGRNAEVVEGAGGRKAPPPGATAGTGLRVPLTVDPAITVGLNVCLPAVTVGRGMAK